MSFELRYHPDVKTPEIAQLDAKLKVRIKHAIETRLTIEPQRYGAPLRKTLHGYWKLQAISELLARHPQKDKLKRGVNAQGGDAPGTSRGGNVGLTGDLSSLSPEERLSRFRQGQAGAAR